MSRSRTRCTPRAHSLFYREVPPLAILSSVTAASDPSRTVVGRYAVYGEILDEARLPEWADLFAQECLYQIITRENYESGYGLCTMQADSRDMILDRVQGILRTQRFIPRYYRRFYSGTRIVVVTEGVIETRQNVLLVQTLIDEPARILLCGVAHDQQRLERQPNPRDVRHSG